MHLALQGRIASVRARVGVLVVVTVVAMVALPPLIDSDDLVLGNRLRPQNIAIDCWQESANPIFPTRNSFPPKSHSIQQKYRRFCQPWGN